MVSPSENSPWENVPQLVFSRVVDEWQRVCQPLYLPWAAAGAQPALLPPFSTSSLLVLFVSL